VGLLLLSGKPGVLQGLSPAFAQGHAAIIPQGDDGEVPEHRAEDLVYEVKRPGVGRSEPRHQLRHVSGTATTEKVDQDLPTLGTEPEQRVNIAHPAAKIVHAPTQNNSGPACLWNLILSRTLLGITTVVLFNRILITIPFQRFFVDLTTIVSPKSVRG